MRSVFLASSLVAVCKGANIVELAEAQPELSTLVAALVAADLVDTLSAPGTFTVYAPTNAAFAALPAGVLDDLLKPENKAALSDILLYHVLGHEFKYGDTPGKIVGGNGYSGNPNIAGVYDSVLGKPLFIDKAGVGALGAQQSFLASNIAADNGVVHIINGVMLPSLVESGRTIDLNSRKEHVVLQEGLCYNRQFNGTAGGGVTGNDQRAFCTEKKLPDSCCDEDGHRITNRYSRTVKAYQYSSNDGSCQNPRIADPNHIGVYAQGSNDFPSLAYVNIDYENLQFICPGDAQPGDEQIVV